MSASTNRGELFKTYDALAAGAVDVLEKPDGDEVEGEWERGFLSAVKLVARIRVITHPRARLGGKTRATACAGLPLRSRPARSPRSRRHRRLDRRAGRARRSAARAAGRLPLPILIVLHINEPFGTAFADGSTRRRSGRVVFAEDGEPVASCAGRVVVAPAGRHLVVRRRPLRLTLDRGAAFVPALGRRAVRIDGAANTAPPPPLAC